MPGIRGSLVWRMMLWFLLLSSLSFGVITIFVRQIVLEELTNIAVDIASAEAEALANEVTRVQDMGIIQNDLRLIVSDPDHLEGFILDSSGTYRAHSEDEKVGQSAYTEISVDITDELFAGTSGTIVDEVSGRLIGYAHVAGGDDVAVVILSSNIITAPMERIERGSAGQVIGALVLITAAGGAAIWTLIGPIGKLNEAARRIGQGDLEAHIDTEGMDDELGVLATSFNEMGAAIQSREQELRAQAESLAQTNRQLEAARREAEEASRHKDLFLATMSHELRTPLNAIIGMLGLMLYSGELQSENQFMAERCTANAERLLSLINNILDLSRIAVGRLEIIPVEMELRAVAEAIQTDMALRMKEKGLEFIVTVDDSLPSLITHDEERIVQIATNLVGNAVKFTEAGCVRLDLSRNRDRLIIRVSDTGIGIPASKQQIIFDEFTQVDSTSTRSHSGAGLGLAIVKQLTVLMHGTFKVESEPGQGSVFSIDLPLSLVPSKQFAAVELG